MPEMPEVETVVRQLLPNILNKEIGSIEVLAEKSVGRDSDFEEKLRGDSFAALHRIGKLMIFSLNKKSDHKLLGHLKMTGQMIYADSKGSLAGGGHTLTETDLNLPHKHTRIIFRFTDGSKLYFNDMRLFGYMKLETNEKVQDIRDAYGIEPMTPNYTWENFQKIFEKRKTNLKALLLNQKIISGLGNIYVDEACFRAKVNPQRLVATLTMPEKKSLFKECSDVMEESINMGGTTFYDFMKADGGKGRYSDFLQVFDRKGQNCIDCDTPIEKIKWTGRGTHFCPRCQK